MAYIPDRLVHDADAHIMEPPNWLRDHADPGIRDRIERPGYANELAQTGDGVFEPPRAWRSTSAFPKQPTLE